MILVLLIVLLALIGAPLFAILAGGAWAGLHSQQTESTVLAFEFYRIADNPVLITIPLFTLAGYVLGESKAPQRLVRVTNSLFGWMPGGLAIVSIVACALFTAFTGASGVTILAMGALLYPALKQAGYSEKFNLGLMTTSGSMGLLFAPSVPLILYGIVAQQVGSTPAVTIEDLFLAGILPGLFMIVALSVYGVINAPKLVADRNKFEAKEIFAALWDARWELPLPFLVLSGVYSGVIAISEAAIVTALYVLIVAVFIRREIPVKRVPVVIREAMGLVGAILLILGASLGLVYWVIDAGMPEKMFNFVTQYVHNKITFLLLLNLFLLVLGMLLDIFSAIVIMVPLLMPIAASFGINPIHLGIIFLANMQIGYFTPPVGMNLFIASYRFNTSVLALTRACIPFFFILMSIVLIITYWPGLSLALLR